MQELQVFRLMLGRMWHILGCGEGGCKMTAQSLSMGNMRTEAADEACVALLVLDQAGAFFVVLAGRMCM